ncbi:MAG: IS30 family transposase [Ruminococcus sp.]|nr:IS30 family transposase [Ruminococcus sp.]
MREVRNNRIFVTSSKTNCANSYGCLKRKICGNSTCFDPCNNCRDGFDCHAICKDFKPLHCSRLDGAPYVCNSCENRNFCSKERAIYSAHKADAKSRKRLSEARSSLHISNDEIAALNALITPLILNGQSLNHIYANHSGEIRVARRTLYDYIDKCVFDVRNIDLPRKVRYKKRRKKRAEPAPYKYRQGRTYEDFQAFIKQSPDLNVVEMDTVKGCREKGKCLLTMNFVRYDFMLAFLIDSASQRCVQQVFDYLGDKMSPEIFERLFPVILTDNGGEFKDPEALEHTSYGSQRTRIFYCDPMASWQKPHVERSHEYIRQVIPKGVSMVDLTQEDITLMMNHINSLSRDSLNGACPFDAAKQLLGRKLPKLLGLKKIPPDDVILRPSLLKK